MDLVSRVRANVVRLLWQQLLPVPDFAFRAGLPYWTVVDWCVRGRKRSLTLRAVEQLAAGLGVDPLDLLQEPDEVGRTRPPTVYEVRRMQRNDGLRTARKLANRV